MTSTVLDLFEESLHIRTKMSFVGKFEQVSEDGWKAFMEALGIPKLLQVAASISTQTMEVTEENGKWKTKTSTRLLVSSGWS